VRRRYAVVGAGIVGLSTAWALARGGAAVTVFEQGPLPNPWAASYDRHRIIRYPYGEARGYARAMTDAYAAWDALWADLGESHYVETGSLALSYAADGWARRSGAVLADLAIAHDWLPPEEVGRRWPFLLTDRIEAGLHVPRGGVLLADRILHALARHLAGRDVELRPHDRVASLDAARGTLRTAEGEQGPFDAIAVAAGPWTLRLLPGLLPGELTPVRQLVVYLEPPAHLERAWREAPALQDIGGTVTDGYGLPAVAGTRAKLGATPVRRPGDPDREREPAPGEGEALLALYRGWIADLDDHRVAETRVCHYMRRPSEKIVLAPVGARAWVCTGDTGHAFKLGALLGGWLADGLSGARPAAELTALAAGEAV